MYDVGFSRKFMQVIWVILIIAIYVMHIKYFMSADFVGRNLAEKPINFLLFNAYRTYYKKITTY
jgi:hypothetical protein